MKILTINVSAFDAGKMAASPLVCDARAGLESLTAALEERSYQSSYGSDLNEEIVAWHGEVSRLYDDLHLDGMLTQTGVMGMLNEKLLPADAVVVGSSGSLPGDMQRLWRSRAANGYHMEYGFSCMGYEISGAVGVKIAEPNREVVSMVGDGSYIMLHSELVTAVREGIKVIVVVFDNSGYQCIDNLQTSQGISSYATYFKTRDNNGRLNGPVAEFDFAANAAAYGVQTWSVKTADELNTAVAGALESKRACLIDVKVAPKSMTGGYDAWWRVGVPEVSASESVKAAYLEHTKMVEKAKPY